VIITPDGWENNSAGQSRGRDLRHAQVKGSIKKTAGRLTGSRRLRAEGRRDRFKGNLKQAGAKVKDAVKH